MEKTKVIFQGYDPNDPRVRYVAIQSEANPPYVWCTYSCGRKDVPNLPEDLIVLPIKSARNLFDFEEGKLAEIVSH